MHYSTSASSSSCKHTRQYALWALEPWPSLTVVHCSHLFLHIVYLQDGRHRALVALGIGAISSSPVASFTRADANRYTTVVTGNDPTRLLQVGVAAAMSAGQGANRCDKW